MKRILFFFFWFEIDGEFFGSVKEEYMLDTKILYLLLEKVLGKKNSRKFVCNLYVCGGIFVCEMRWFFYWAILCICKSMYVVTIDIDNYSNYSVECAYVLKFLNWITFNKIFVN